MVGRQDRARSSRGTAGRGAREAAAAGGVRRQGAGERRIAADGEAADRAPTDAPGEGAGAASVCPCCGAAATGRYCASCGQDNAHARLSTRSLFARIVEEVTDADSRLWTTVLGLTRAPGRFAREYVDGKRADRYPPFRYLVVVFATSLLLAPWTSPPMDPSVVGQPGAERAYDLIVRYFNLYGIAAVFLAGLALRVTSPRAGLNYAEHTAFMLYALAQGTLASMAMLPLILVSYWTFAAVGTIALFAYAIVAAVQFYEGPVLGRVARVLFALFVYYAASMFVGGMIVLAVMLSELAARR